MKAFQMIDATRSTSAGREKRAKVLASVRTPALAFHR
jgi:hypothetical protein